MKATIYEIAAILAAGFLISACGGGDGSDVEPSMPVNTVTDQNTTANSISEKAVIGTEVGITVLAKDTNTSDTVTYSLHDNAGGLFQIDADTGIVTLAGTLNYETQAAYVIGVTATSSDGSQSSENLTITVEDYPPVSLTFPLPNGIYTRNSITVKGRVAVENTEKVTLEIDAGSTPKTVTPDSDGKFSAFPSVAGDNVNQTIMVNIRADDGNGETSLTSVKLSSEPTLAEPEAVVFDAVSSRALVIDSKTDALVAIDIGTGRRTLISSVNRGTGTSLDHPSDLVLSPNANKAYVADWGIKGIIEVNLDTGNRTVLSNGANGQGPAFVTPNSIAYNSGDGSLVVLDFHMKALVSVDPSTGNRTVISDNNIASTVYFEQPQNLVLDVENNLAYVRDGIIEGNSGYSIIYTVDLNTGARNLFASGADGQEVMLYSDDMLLDVVNNRLLTVIWNKGVVAIDLLSDDRSWISTGVYAENPYPNLRSMAAIPDSNKMLLLDSAADAILSLDLASGEITALSRPAVGSGPLLKGPVDIAYDSESGKAFVADVGLVAIFKVDTLTGDREIFAKDHSLGRCLALDKPNNRLLGAYGDSIYSLDLDTAAEAKVATCSELQSEGTGFRFLDLEIDPLTQQLYGLFSNAVVAVDLPSGICSVLSGENVGTGPEFYLPHHMALDINRKVLYVTARGPATNSSLASVISVDLTTGDRSIVTDNTVSSGFPTNLDPRSIFYDEKLNRLFVGDFNRGLVQVSLGTGIQSQLNAPQIDINKVMSLFDGAVVDMKGERVFIVDSQSTNAISVIDLTSLHYQIISR